MDINILKEDLQNPKNPRFLQSAVNLCLHYNNLGKFIETIDVTNKALKNRVIHNAIIGNRGYAYLKLKKYNLAIKYFKKILTKNKNDNFTKFNYAVCLKLTNNNAGYLKLINETIVNDQTFLNSFLDLYEYYRNLNKVTECLKLLNLYDKKINRTLKNLLQINLFPIVYKSKEETEKIIDNIDIEIKNSISELKLRDCKDLKVLLNHYLPPTNFYLSYANYKTLQIQKNYSILLENISNNFDIKKEHAIVKNRRKKVAFVSSILNKHTVTNLFINWYKLINKDTFEPWLIDTGSIQDEHYAELIKNNDKYYRTVGNLEIDINFLRKQNFDFVIFFDYHMSRYNQFLSRFKFGHKTCVTWGHPLTTYNKGIDFFLSGEELENSLTEKNYSEKLIKLNNLSVCYNDIPQDDIEKNNYVEKKEGEINIGILQSMFKILPDEDEIFVNILNNFKKTKLYFLSSGLNTVDKLFKNRIAEKLSNKNNIEKLYFLPKTKRKFYLDYIKNMDFLIDSLSWSGGNTHFEALSLNKPILTVHGSTLKQNVTSGLLKRINCKSLIQENKNDFFKKIEYFINNKSFINENSLIIEKNKMLLFNDISTINSLEDFISKN